MAEGYSF